MTPRYMRLYEVAQVVPSKLVFVASALRSGSTLLRLMLNSHPRISSPGEFDFLFDSLGTDADRNKVHAFEANRFLAHLQQSRIFRSLEISLPDGEENCMGLIRRIVGQIAAGVDVLALNLHRNFVTARQVFPSASFIHPIIMLSRTDVRTVLVLEYAAMWFPTLIRSTDRRMEICAHALSRCCPPRAGGPIAVGVHSQ